MSNIVDKRKKSCHSKNPIEIFVWHGSQTPFKSIFLFIIKRSIKIIVSLGSVNYFPLKNTYN